VISARDYPAFTTKPARLALMDEQGVQAAIMLPTLGVAVEYDLRGDTDLAYASLRAFNRWLEEDWDYGADGRIFAVPLLSLLDPGQALVELHRVIAAGARLVHLCPGPAGDRSPADPAFDPFWATCADAGIPVVFHVSNSGYQHFYGTRWSEDPGNPSHLQSPLQWAMCNTERPVVDTLTALTLHNLFGRHPAIKILSMENGSDWLKPLLKTVDKAAALGRRGPMIGGPLPEGLREPRDYTRRLEGCHPAVTRQVLRGNTARLLGLADHAPTRTNSQDGSSNAGQAGAS
jgi:predicted TIM-barrel fold metal-dependent hydrolase